MGDALPEFVIAGMMRCGTTSLSAWLRHHPDVVIPAVKEVHFFDQNYERGLGWYSEHFRRAGPDQVPGEATPDYVYVPEAVRRIAADLPDVKLVFLLRDPVARAHSHYLHNTARTRETLGFEEAIDAEPERLARLSGPERARFAYVDRGRYLHQLKAVLELFPREQVMVQLFEDLRDRPRPTFAAIADFLGVDSGQVPEEVGAQVNAYQTFRSVRVRDLSRRLPKRLVDAVGRVNRVPQPDYPTLPPPARERLLDVYGAERDELRELLGRDLHEWRS